MIPARFAPVLFGFILSGLMSCIVSAIATLRAVGLPPDFVGTVDVLLGLRLGGGLPHGAVVAPITRKLVARLTAAAAGAERASSRLPRLPFRQPALRRVVLPGLPSRASAQPGSIRPAATSRRPWLA
jgi:hypothetical protein